MTIDNLSEHIDVQTIFKTSVVPEEDRGINMLLLDDDQIPHDLRVRLTTQAGYSSEYTSTSTPYLYAQDFWSQDLKASSLMFGRWVASDAEGYYVGGEPITAIAGYVALTAADGFSFAVDGIDGGAGAGVAVDINGFDFSLVSDFDDVLAEINSVLHTVNAGAFADYDFALDSTGRIFVSDDTDVGASSAEVTVGSPSAGTDMTTSTYLNMTSGFWADGIDAETPTEAINAIKEINNSWYCLTVRGEDNDEKIEISTVINADTNKVCVLWEGDYTACNDPSSTTQACAVIKALTHRRTFIVHHPSSDTITKNPDAVLVGAHIPADEGSIDWANQQLFNATSVNLGATKKAILKVQNITWFETNKGITTNPYGLTMSGNEMRHVVGRDWFNGTIQDGVYSAKIKAKSWGFNISTFGAMSGIVRATGKEAIDRGFCVNTEAKPFTVNFPDPDTFTDAERASHDAQLTEVFKIHLDSAIYDSTITGTMEL